MKKKPSSLSVLALSVPAIAFIAVPVGAQEMYIQGNLGYAFSSDASGKSSAKAIKVVDRQGNNVSIDPDALAKGTKVHSYDAEPSGMFTLSGTIGMMLDKSFAAEIELAHWEVIDDDTKTRPKDQMKDYKVEQSYGNTALMANALYHISTNKKLTPYIGAGLGINFADFTYDESEKAGIKRFRPILNDEMSGDTTALATQGILGLAMAIANQTDLVIDYRLTYSMGSMTAEKSRREETREGTTTTYTRKIETDIPLAHRLQGGIRFRF